MVAMSQMQIRDWRPMPKNSLIGFGKVERPSGLILCDVTIHISDRGAWASPPAKPMLNADGVALKDDAGKVRYVAVIGFKSKEVRDRFSAGVLVLEALQTAHPESLE